MLLKTQFEKYQMFVCYQKHKIENTNKRVYQKNKCKKQIEKFETNANKRFKLKIEKFMKNDRKFRIENRKLLNMCKRIRECENVF